LVICFGCNPPAEPEAPYNGPPKVGKPAPEIIATTLDGKPFRLSEHRGKVVVIDFWATWCGPCVNAMPFMRSLYARYKDQQFVLVGVSLDRKREALTRYVESNEIPWAQIHDQNAIPSRWEVDSIPRLFIIDDTGIVRYIISGGNNDAQIERGVKNLLSDLATKS
jgi:thiol-disulfide isomerase/thioredoxin